MSSRSVRLPIYKSGDTFAIGSQVRLRSDSSGAAGVVKGSVRGRIIVRWPIDGEGKHRPDSLIAVKPDAADAPRNPYLRLLAKLDAANGRSGGSDK